MAFSSRILFPNRIHSTLPIELIYIITSPASGRSLKRVRPQKWGSSDNEPSLASSAQSRERPSEAPELALPPSLSAVSSSLISTPPSPGSLPPPPPPPPPHVPSASTPP